MSFNFRVHCCYSAGRPTEEKGMISCSSRENLIIESEVQEKSSRKPTSDLGYNNVLSFQSFPLFSLMISSVIWVPSVCPPPDERVVIWSLLVNFMDV